MMALQKVRSMALPPLMYAFVLEKTRRLVGRNFCLAILFLAFFLRAHHE